jgi:hypothetical protein
MHIWREKKVFFLLYTFIIYETNIVYLLFFAYAIFLCNCRSLIQGNKGATYTLAIKTPCDADHPQECCISSFQTFNT